MKNLNLFAFQIWSKSGELQMSDLYEGDAASSFIDNHYSSGTFADIIIGGIEVKKKYLTLKKELTRY